MKVKNVTLEVSPVHLIQSTLYLNHTVHLPPFPNQYDGPVDLDAYRSTQSTHLIQIYGALK